MPTNGRRRAAVQLFAYDEPDTIRWSMDGHSSVDEPPGWDVDFEAWVTPTGTRYTISEAEAHRAFRAFEAPPGKLSSRNAAHDSATHRGYDVIVLADADEPPLRGDYLKRLLAPFDQPGVVGVSGFPKDTSWAAPVMDTIRRLDQATGPIRGNSSAFTTPAWEAAGPFRTDQVDEADLGGVRGEEEFAFRRRLANLGRVVDRYDATVRANNRRNVCMVMEAMNPVRGAQTGYCGRRGVATFAPVEREGCRDCP